MLDHLDSPAAWLELIGSILAWAPIALLIPALCMQLVRREPLIPRGGALTLASVAVVMAAILAAVVSSVVARVSVGVDVWTLATFFLVLLLLRNDQRFWVALAGLTLGYTVIGFFSVWGLAHAYDSDAGGWRGSRLLVAWAGPSGNPAHELFGWAHWSLALVRYGLPLAMTVALGWVLVARPVMTRLERGALLFTAGGFLAQVLVGAALSAITFGVSVVAGLPLWLGVAGLVGSVVMLVTVGPGAVSGIVVGLQSLLRPAHLIGEAHGLITTVGDAVRGPGADAMSEDGSPDEARHPSFLRYLTGGFGWVQKASLVGVVVAIGLVVGLRALGGGEGNQVSVRYEPVHQEAALPTRVVTSAPSAEGGLWIHEADRRLRHFDPTQASFADFPHEVTSSAVLGDDVLAVVLRPDSAELWAGTSLADLRQVRDDLGRGAVVSAGTDAFFMLDGHDTLLRVDAGGTTLASLPLDLPEVLAVTDGSPWTFQAVLGNPTLSHNVVVHDPRTLAPVSTRPGYQQGSSLIMMDDGSAWTRRDQAVVTQAGVRRGQYTYGPMGLVTHHAPDGDRRMDFHYDLVQGIHDLGENGTWIIAEDSIGIALTPRADRLTYLARWDGSPGAP